MESGGHVLVHCSDGWDRTAQLTSIVQICLDPYYRTLKGFQVLIEKEWIRFGHKFHERCGNLIFEGVPSSIKDRKSKDFSPVFQQFLDCVFQILNWYPNSFEFTEKLLLEIFEASYSMKYINFIFNNEKERSNLAGKSIWDSIDAHQQTYANLEYDPDNRQTLRLRHHPQFLIFWKNLYIKK